MAKKKMRTSLNLERVRKNFRTARLHGAIIDGKKVSYKSFKKKGIVYDFYAHTFQKKSSLQYGYVAKNMMGYYSRSNSLLIGTKRYMTITTAMENGEKKCPQCNRWIVVGTRCGCPTIFSYHDPNSPRLLKVDPTFPLKIGYEIEKEDSRLSSWILNAHELYIRSGWAVERDGSLGSNGYELISPVLPLDVEWIADEISDIGIKPLINAKHSANCGGHISISKAGIGTQTLFKTHFKGVVHLLYAMYHKRCNNSYCQTFKFNEYASAGRSAFNLGASSGVLNGRMEIRLFSSPKNVTTLLWRTELLRTILENKFDEFEKINEAIEVLSPLLSKVYDTKDKWNTLMDNVKKYAEKTDGYVVTIPKREMIVPVKFEVEISDPEPIDTPFGIANNHEAIAESTNPVDPMYSDIQDSWECRHCGRVYREEVEYCTCEEAEEEWRENHCDEYDDEQD